jgi:hypothetical protein
MKLREWVYNLLFIYLFCHWIGVSTWTGVISGDEFPVASGVRDTDQSNNNSTQIPCQAFSFFWTLILILQYLRDSNNMDELLQNHRSHFVLYCMCRFVFLFNLIPLTVNSERIKSTTKLNPDSVVLAITLVCIWTWAERNKTKKPLWSQWSSSFNYNVFWSLQEESAFDSPEHTLDLRLLFVVSWKNQLHLAQPVFLPDNTQPYLLKLELHPSLSSDKYTHSFQTKPWGHM